MHKHSNPKSENRIHVSFDKDSFLSLILIISAFVFNEMTLYFSLFSYLQEEINLNPESENPTEDPIINFVRAIDKKEGKIEVFIVEENLG